MSNQTISFPAHFFSVLVVLHLLLPSLLWPAITPNGLFKSGMVLQRGMDVPVWGTADANEVVTVKILTQTVTATAAASGKWTAKLAPMVAGGPYTMTISGTKGELITLATVYIGDVWVLSGQSNMGMTVAEADAATQAAMNDNYPEIRLLLFPTPSVWQGASGSAIGAFSAVGYWFGRTVHLAQHVPIGLIDAALGGTIIESWCPGGDNYNVRIFPLTNFAIKGVAWYQGEWDFDRYVVYRESMDTLITGWRNAWNQGDFPFLFGQTHKSPGAYPMSTVSVYNNFANLREAQRLALSVPNTGMVITVDVSNSDLHPPNKKPVGERFGWAAGATVYSSLTPSQGLSPLFKSVTMQGTNAVIAFANADNGLTAQGSTDGTVNNMVVFNGNSTTTSKVARAKVNGSTVVVDLAGETDVRGLYYAWSDHAAGNLYNTAGLPASPFRIESVSFRPVVFSQTTIVLRANMLLDTAVAKNPASFQIGGRSITGAAVAERGLSIALTVDRPFALFEKLTISFPGYKTWDGKSAIDPLSCTVTPGIVCTGFRFKEYLLDFATTESVAAASHPCANAEWKYAGSSRGVVDISPWAAGAPANVPTFSHLYLYSDTTQIGLIRSRGPGLTKAFLNGSPVAMTFPGNEREDFSERVTVSKGWNSLVFSTTNSATNHLAVRMVDTNGYWFKGLSYQAGCDSVLPVTSVGPLVNDNRLSGSLTVLRQSGGIRIAIGSGDDHVITVTGLSGKIIARYTGKNSSVYSLDRKELSPGLYVARCITRGMSLEKKFVVY